MMDRVGTPMQSHKRDDLASSARTAFLVAWSLLALFGEALLLLHLWSVRTQPSVAASSYILPGAHLLPWLAAMQWLWKVRRGVRNGTLDSSAASMLYSVISDALGVSYVALIVVESMVGSIWKF